MLCLTCGNDNADHFRRDCARCGAPVGFPAEGSGYLPQLRHIEEKMLAGEIDEAAVEERLARLENAYQFLLTQVETQIANLMNLGLDELQETTVLAFLDPLRKGLAASLEIVTELPNQGCWSEQVWLDLRAAQLDIMRGNQGLIYLGQVMAGPANG